MTSLDNAIKLGRSYLIQQNFNRQPIELSKSWPGAIMGKCLSKTVDSGCDYPNKFVILIVLSLV